MAKFILEIPENLHDKLRIEKVKRKKNMDELIIEFIGDGLKNGKTKRI